MKVPLLDLKAQYLSIQDEVQEAIHKVLESQRFVLGPEVGRARSGSWDVSASSLPRTWVGWETAAW